jgi:NitT/TauT family transport system substrate-binding protein
VIVASAPAQAATDIIVGIQQAAVNAQVQYAQDNGIFAANGINATIKSAAPPALIAQLAAGQIQFMYLPLANAITARTNGGINLKIVAPANGISYLDARRMQRDPKFAALTDTSAMCVKADSPIKRGKDLQGKVVVVGSRGGLSELDFREFVRKDGGDPNTIKWTVSPMGPGLDLVKSGRADVAYAALPFTSACNQDGLKILKQADFVVNPAGGPTAAWVTTADYAAKNPTVVKAFQKSMWEVNAQLAGNSAKAKANREKMIAAMMKVSGQPREFITAYKLPYFFAGMRQTDITPWANALQRNGLVVKPVDIPGLLATQYRP